MVFERKILRIIFGPIRENGEWRIPYNHDLKELYQHADVVKKIRTKRLSWAGHIVRMDVDQLKKCSSAIRAEQEEEADRKQDG